MEWLTLISWGFPSLRVGSDDGLTIIVRDRAQEDKVVKVIEPLDTVYLTYDFEDEGRLQYIRTVWDNYESIGSVSQLHKLFYEPYLNSDNEIESVLGKVRQITKITKVYMDGVTVTRLSAENEKIYEAIYSELTNLDTINAKRSLEWDLKNLEIIYTRKLLTQ